MAKFFITNNKKIYDSVIGKIEASEFNIGANFAVNNMFIVTVKKLLIDNINCWKKNNDVVITTGTPIYKTSINNISILDDFVQDVDSIRKDMIGQYAVAIRKNNLTTIFGDSSGVYNIYYFFDGHDYLISNDISDMASVLDNRVSPSTINILEEACQNSIIGGESLYNEIKRLRGYEKILIFDENRLVIEYLPIKKRILGLSYNDCVVNISDNLKYKAKIIKNVFGNPDIFMTGGLDARISLATYLSIGAKPSLHYGIGNSEITNTKHEDLEIARMFANKFNLSLYEEDWNTPSPFYRDWDYYISKFGVLASVYAASDSIMKGFENLPNLISTFGYGGELYRNLPWIENRKKGFFTVEDFIDKYYIGLNPARISIKNVNGYRERLIKKFNDICEIYNLNPNHIENIDNIYLLLEYRSYADTKLVNLLNYSKYSNLLLFEKECLQNIGVSLKDMNNSHFMIDIIRNLYEEVLDIPIFSHCNMKIYDKNQRRVLPLNKSYKSIIREYLPEKLIDFIRKSIITKSKVNSTSPIYKDYLAIKDKYSLFPGCNLDYSLDIRFCINYLILLEAIIKCK